MATAVEYIAKLMEKPASLKQDAEKEHNTHHPHHTHTMHKEHDAILPCQYILLSTYYVTELLCIP
jgi:hypothetical protein